MPSLSLVKAVEAHDDGVMSLAAWEKPVDETTTATHIVSGGIDGMLKVWTADGTELSDKKCHRETVNKVLIPAQAPWNGEYVVTAGDDGFVKVWAWDAYPHTATPPVVGKKLAETKQEGGVNAMVVAMENFIATGNDSGEIFVYEAELSQETAEDGSVKKACKLSQVTTFAGSMEAINCILYVDAGLWTSGDDGFLRRWQVDDLPDTDSSAAAEAAKEEAEKVEGVAAMFTNLVPTCNIPTVEVGPDTGVMVNVLVHQETPDNAKNPHGFMWCSVATQGVSLWQKRQAVEGYILCSIPTSDWSRALVFPTPTTALLAQDDGKLAFFPVTTEEDPAEMSGEKDMTLPEMTVVPNCPSAAIMDLLVNRGIAVSTCDTQLRFWTIEA